MMKRIILLSLGALFLMAGCHRTPPIIEPESNNEAAIKEHLINANKVVAESEDTQINAYIERRGWKMESLTGGVRLMVTKQGNGSTIDYDDKVILNYSVSALDGNTIYSQISDTIIVGKNQTTSGMEIALKKLNRGSDAIVILPSQTAYGVVGDGDKIPTRAVLVIDLKCN